MNILLLSMLGCGEKDTDEINTAPELLNLIIEPSEPTTDSELRCIATVVDTDNDPVQVTYEWLYGAETVGASEHLMLDPSWVQPTDVLTCQASISDGQDVVEGSVEVTVSNQPPTVTEVIIEGDSFRLDSTLMCSSSQSDPDMEVPMSSLVWHHNGVVVGESAELYLDPESFAVDDEISCTVTVEDGYGGVASMSKTVMVENSAPVVMGVRLTPENPSTQDVLTCVPDGAFDIDGDSVSVETSWFVDGVQQTESSNEWNGLLMVNQEILCQITPYDGRAYGESTSASVVVVNTPPSIDALSIQSNGPVFADGAVECVVVGSDIDGAVTSSVEWSTDSVLGTDAILSLTPTLVAPSDVLTCTATVIDAEGVSVSDSVNVQIENTPPVVSVLPSIVGTPQHDETLVCAGEITDLNDGTLMPSYTWVTADGTTIGTGNTWTVDATVLAVGESVACMVEGVDAHGASTSDAITVWMENSLPVVTSAELLQNTLYTNDVLEVDVGLSDVNPEQGVSAEIEWHVVDSTGQDSIVQTGSNNTLSGAHFDKEETVYAVVTPFDGVEHGLSVTTAFIEVANTVPTVPEIELMPTVPHLETDDLFCEVVVESLDVDGDVVEYLFEWLDASGVTLDSVQQSETLATLSSEFVPFPQVVTCRVTPFDDDVNGASVETNVEVEYACDCPTTTNRDYAFTYWPENFRHANFNQHGFYTTRHFVTGHYGAQIDLSTGNLTRLAHNSAPLSMDETGLSEDSWIQSGLSSDVTYAVNINGTVMVATDFVNSDETGLHATDNPSMLMDMGRFQQHIEIPELFYQGSADLIGSLGISSTPQQLVLTHRVQSAVSYTGSVSIQTILGGDLWSQAQVVNVLEGTRAIEIEDLDGVHWVLIAPESTDNITQGSTGEIVISRTVTELTAGEELSIPVVIIPSEDLSTEQIAMYLDPEGTVEVQSRQMNQSDDFTSSATLASWNWERGMFQVVLGNIRGSGASANSANWSNGTDFNIYNRHWLNINHNSNEDLHIPLFFDGPINTTFNITGGAPLFRSMDKEPTGIPIQVSKNWHIPGYWPNWFHMYSAPTVSSGGHEMELTVAIGKWGETFAASHAQLSLVGWGTNQQWDESALGAWGESITYDPDKTLRRAMVDDVRPFLMNVNGQYNWTGNVGGADFLTYVDANGQRQQPTQLKTVYRAPGPVMTDVVYAGRTADDAIEFTAQTHLVRTDDLVRAYYVLRYDFLTDVEYSRLAFFQIAADNYSDNGFTKYAYGDATGVLFDDVVPNHNSTGYASQSDRGIVLTGAHPWAFMYDSNKTGGNLPEHVADVGFVIRDYQATINGQSITTPHININRTRNGGWSQMAFEVGLPYDPSNTLIEAGSHVDLIVEYLVVPNDISLYYGPSADMASVVSTDFGSTNIIERLAADNALSVSATVGTVTQHQPVIVEGVVDTVAAEFTVSGGFGYTPISIAKLYRVDGWRLQSFDNGVWADVDQSVHENDFWQAQWDEMTLSYILTFSVETDQATTFRLIQQP